MTYRDSCNPVGLFGAMSFWHPIDPQTELWAAVLDVQLRIKPSGPWALQFGYVGNSDRACETLIFPYGLWEILIDRVSKRFERSECAV